MSQHDQVINDGPGATVRSDFNAALAALFSTSSGNTEPAVKSPGMLWFDTSVVGANVLKMRDQTNTAWIQIWPLVQPSARAHRAGSGNVALTAATWTKINLSTLQTNVGGFSLSGNSLVIPRAGTYLVHGQANCQTSAATSNDILCGVSVNGAITAPVLHGRMAEALAGYFAVNTTGVVTLAANANLQLVAYSSISGTTVWDTIDATALNATLLATT